MLPFKLLPPRQTATTLVSTTTIPAQLLTGAVVSQPELKGQCGPSVLLYKATSARESCTFTCAVRVFVLETKGIHLKNEDTKYKQDVFALCNELGAKKAWKELFNEFPDHDFEFQVVFEDEWHNKINGMMK